MKIKLLTTVIGIIGSSLFASPKEYTASCAGLPCKKEIKAASISLKTEIAAEELGQSPVAHFFTLDI
jgi:hypothetical protein